MAAARSVKKVDWVADKLGAAKVGPDLWAYFDTDVDMFYLYSDEDAECAWDLAHDDDVANWYSDWCAVAGREATSEEIRTYELRTAILGVD